MESLLMGPGNVVLARFPFGGTVGAKLRPVLLLTGTLGTVPEFLVSYITSVIPADRLPSDILLDPAQPQYASTKLKAPSLLRLHKLATIHASDIVRSIGQMSPAAWQEVEAKLRSLLNL
jgi:mRNA interferase MazF